MAGRIIRDERDLAQWVTFLERQTFPMTVSKLAGANRSHAQNRTAHAWYSQIAGWDGDHTAAQAKAHCKMTHGKQILIRDNPEWQAKWEPLYGPLDYETEVKLFECLPVTSVMRVKQMNEFMNAVQLEYRVQGIPLIDPEMQKYEAVR